MKVLYLAAGKAEHPNFNVTYQDAFINRDIGGDMLCVPFDGYDVIVATPPCNFYSRANYRRYNSYYALSTMHLLPAILRKCIDSGKFFVVENVRNKKLFDTFHLYDLDCFYYEIGRHTYWSNIPLFESDLELLRASQTFDFKCIKGYGVVRLKSNTQGGDNVHLVIDYFLKKVGKIV